MPGCSVGSEKLHLVITLVCGMGNDPHSQEDLPPPEEGAEEEEEKVIQLTPMTRLKEALSSPEAFRKHFLVRL